MIPEQDTQVTVLRQGSKTTIRILHIPTGKVVEETGSMIYTLRLSALAKLEKLLEGNKR